MVTLARRLISEDFDSLPMGQFSWFSLLVSSIAFGLMHGHGGWPGPSRGCSSRWRSIRPGKFMDAVVAHATANTLIASYVLATGHWAAWS